MNRGTIHLTIDVKQCYEETKKRVREKVQIVTFSTSMCKTLTHHDLAMLGASGMRALLGMTLVAPKCQQPMQYQSMSSQALLKVIPDH